MVEVLKPTDYVPQKDAYINEVNPWRRHGVEVQKLVELASRDLVLWARRNPGASVRDLEFFARGLVKQYGSLAVSSALKAIETSREAAGLASELPPPQPAPAMITEQIAGTVAYALNRVEDKNILTVANRWLPSLGRLVQQAARDTTLLSVSYAGTRYARLPGPFACSFCLMLASRGSAYLSKDTAGFVTGRSKRPEGAKFHDHCDCVVIESHTAGDLPKQIKDLRDEWHLATYGYGTPGEQRAAWKAYIDRTRPNRTQQPDAVGWSDRWLPDGAKFLSNPGNALPLATSAGSQIKQFDPLRAVKNKQFERGNDATGNAYKLIRFIGAKTQDVPGQVFVPTAKNTPDVVIDGFGLSMAKYDQAEKIAKIAKHSQILVVQYPHDASQADLDKIIEKWGADFQRIIIATPGQVYAYPPARTLLDVHQPVLNLYRETGKAPVKGGGFVTLQKGW